MLAAKRHENIVSILKDEGSVRVLQLAQKFDVTEETIRRDFEKLEKKGSLIRSHGGAVPPQGVHADMSFVQRMIRNVEAKRSIAKMALTEIHEGDCIFLDGSTTACQIAQRLPDIPLTLISDSLRVLMELSPLKNIKLIILGGELLRTTQTMIGPFANQSIRDYNVDKLFFSCQGLDIEWGISDIDIDIASLRKALIEQSVKKYLLVDHSKFKSRSNFRITGVDVVDYVFSDKDCDTEMKNFFKKNEVEFRSSQN